MSIDRVVIPHDHLPTRWPVFSTLLMYMAVDLYPTPPWAYWTVVVAIVLFWVGSLIRHMTEVSYPLPGHGRVMGRYSEPPQDEGQK